MADPDTGPSLAERQDAALGHLDSARRYLDVLAEAGSVKAAVALIRIAEARAHILGIQARTSPEVSNQEGPPCLPHALSKEPE